jgi:hypothetical protein
LVFSGYRAGKLTADHWYAKHPCHVFQLHDVAAGNKIVVGTVETKATELKTPALGTDPDFDLTVSRMEWIRKAYDMQRECLRETKANWEARNCEARGAKLEREKKKLWAE